MKAKILVVSPKGFSPKRHYRGEGVMDRLPLLDPEIEILYPRSDELWKDLLRCDIVYMFHCIEPFHMEVMKQCLNMRIPLWYDCDDNLFEIPKDNPASQTITRPLIENHLFMLRQADVISVTVEYLADLIQGKAGKRPIVIPNAIDDYVFNDWDTFPEPDDNCMAWRGGASHEGDLLDATEEIWKFLEKTESKKYIQFMGYYPWWIEKGFPWRPKNFEGRTEHTPYIYNHYEYLLAYKNQIKPWAQFVPLSDNPFNRGKSNIAALEAAYAGVLPIVPNYLPEWKEMPGIEYGGPKNPLNEIMKKAIELKKSDRKEIQIALANHVKEYYSLSVINQRRLQVIKALLQAK